MSSRVRPLVAAVVLAAGPLVAQSDAGSTAEASGEQVPVAQFQSRVEEALKAMRGALTKGLEIIKDARESNDAIKLRCVNEQVAQMKGVLRITQDANVSLQEALLTRENERARYEFEKVRTSRAKMAELLNTAQHCVGSQASYAGGTELVVDIDPIVAMQDPYYGDPSLFFNPNEALSADVQEELGADEPPAARPPVVSVFE